MTSHLREQRGRLFLSTDYGGHWGRGTMHCVRGFPGHVTGVAVFCQQIKISWLLDAWTLTRLPVALLLADKVAVVRADTEAAPTPEIKNTATDHLSSWTAVTASEVEKMIGLAANKTCSLDPAPTWLIKQFHHTHTVYCSFRQFFFKQ